MYSDGQLAQFQYSKETHHGRQANQLCSCVTLVVLTEVGTSAHISFSEQLRDLIECLYLPKSPLESCAPPYLTEGSTGWYGQCLVLWDLHAYAALLPLSCPVHVQRTACGISSSPARDITQSIASMHTDL